MLSLVRYYNVDMELRFLAALAGELWMGEGYTCSGDFIVMHLIERSRSAVEMNVKSAPEMPCSPQLAWLSTL